MTRRADNAREYLIEAKKANSIHEENDVSNRHMTWWKNAWWIRVDSGPHLRTARGRRRIWRAARRAAGGRRPIPRFSGCFRPHALLHRMGQNLVLIPCPRRSKLRAFGTLTATSAIPLVASWEARCRMRSGLVSLGVAPGGIGARRAVEHAPAAYVSSLAQSQELCARIWPGFDEYDIDGGLQPADTEFSLLSSFLPSANIYGSSNTPSQQSLSAKIEVNTCRHLLDPSSRERHRLAHFGLHRVPGAGAWLFALPDSQESHIPSPLFRVSLRRRLRMPIWSQDTTIRVQLNSNDFGGFWS